MGIFGALLRGLKGVGKWAVNHPDTVKTFTEAGVSIYDARKRNKPTTRNSTVSDYTLSNLNERINQLQEQVTEEIATVRTDIHTISSELQQDYIARIAALSQQVEDIRIAQSYQARALKRVTIIYGLLIGALIAGVVVLFVV